MHLNQYLQSDSTIIFRIASRHGGAGDFQAVIPADNSISSGAKGMLPGPIAQGSYSTRLASVRELMFGLRARYQRANVWRQHLLNKESSTDVDTISETVDSVLEAVAFLGASRIDLEHIDLPNTNMEHLVAILRSTFSWRRELPGWHAALAVARELLNQGHINSDVVLQGLDE